MKKKLAMCFRPVVIEEEEEEAHDPTHVNDHLDANLSARCFVTKGRRRRPGSTDEKHTAPSGHDPRRNNGSSRKILSGVLKSLWFQSSLRFRMVPKVNGAKESDDHVGNEEPKEQVGKNIHQANKIHSNPSCFSSLSLTTTFTSPSTSTSSSVSSSEIDNIKPIPLKRSLIPRSSSISLHHKKKPKTTKASDKALKSSPNQEGFVFYLVILALVLMTLCGKLYAMMLTSFSLYFIGFHRRQRPANAVKLPEK